MPSRFNFFLRKAARVPKNPPAAVRTQIVAVTAVSLVVSIFCYPVFRLFLLVLPDNDLITLAELQGDLGFCGLVSLQDSSTHSFWNHALC